MVADHVDFQGFPRTASIDEAIDRGLGLLDDVGDPGERQR
jgi:hypothetical protein